MYLKCKLSESLTTVKSLHFPHAKKQTTFLRHRVVVGIGGNIGDVKRRFEHLYCFFKNDKRVELLQTSKLLKNPPFGFKEQDDFLNAIVVLKTNMTPFVFLDYLMRVEKLFGRKRSFANAPRSLDLDIIFYDNEVINTSKLTIPHAEWSQRESVIIPLMDIKL